MAASPDSKDAIERDMEQTRKHLASTIDQLVHRSSPKTIASRQMASIRGYFVGPEGPRTDHIVKVVGGVVGVVAVFVLVRKVVK